jgi:hypothetical protein
MSPQSTLQGVIIGQTSSLALPTFQGCGYFHGFINENRKRFLVLTVISIKFLFEVFLDVTTCSLGRWIPMFSRNLLPLSL